MYYICLLCKVNIYIEIGDAIGVCRMQYFTHESHKKS